MSFLQPVPTVRRPVRPPRAVLPVLAVLVALLWAAGCGSPAVASTQAPPVTASPASPRQPRTPPVARAARRRPRGTPALHGPGAGRRRRPAARRGHGRRRHLPGREPASTRACSRALRSAAADAGIDFRVNSGWRSPAYQEQLLDEAVARYGSRAAAARWVATPATSPHVSGDAVDLADSDATAWLAEARRRVRAVPGLPERALALRAAPRGRRRRVPGPVRRPHARPEDAAVTGRPVRCAGRPRGRRPGATWPPCSWSTSPCSVWTVLWKLEVPWVGGERMVKLVPFVATGGAGASAPLEVVVNLAALRPVRPLPRPAGARRGRGGR